VIATGHELVSQAASEVLENGGNAFDAAVAGGFAGAVAEQTLTSLGGGGFLMARTAGITGPAEEIFFDFFVDTPGRGLDHVNDPHFFPVTIPFGGADQIFNVGMGSVAVPGTLKGLLHVHKRLGRIPLIEVLQPAIRLARGHILNDFQATFLKMLHPIMTLTATGRDLYEPGGRYLAPGDTLVNDGMADFLTSLSEDRGASFYRGEIARRIDREMKEGQGLLTYEDLAAYTVVERRPLRIAFRGHTLLTSPPPSQGGALISLSLGLWERLPHLERWGSAEHLLRTTCLMREVEHLRDLGISSPEQIRFFLEEGDVTGSTERIRSFSRGTTHLSIADHEGNVASMTCSNGEGSGYFAPGTGIMLNNMMGEDDLHPEGFHSSPAGERVASMMSPTVVLQDGEVKLALGSGGSKRIRTAITQVLTQVIDFGRDVSTAVNAPRLHWDGEVLQVEPGFPEDVIEVLQKHFPVNVWQERNVYFGGVHTVIPGKECVGDPRRGGAVAVVERCASIFSNGSC